MIGETTDSSEGYQCFDIYGYRGELVAGRFPEDGSGYSTRCDCLMYGGDCSPPTPCQARYQHDAST